MLLLAGAAVQVAYLLFPFVLECDAAMYYSYGRYLLGLDGGVFTHHRPPGYPLYLILTGQYAFDSFIGPVLGQALMGVLLPILLYRTLEPFHQRIALATALVYIATTFPFLQAKVMNADQLFSFLLVAMVYAWSRFYLTRCSRHLFAFFLVGACALLTRNEAAISVVTLGAVAALIAWKAGAVKPLVAAAACLLVIVAGWSVVRSRFVGDARLIGSLTNASGYQLLYRAYMYLPMYVLDWKVALGLRDAARGPDLVDLSLNDTRAEGIVAGEALMSPANGPASQQLHQTLAGLAGGHPETFRGLRGPLSQVTPGDPALAAVDYYQTIFGRFDGRPAEFADNFFRQPTSFVFDYAFGQLPGRIGIAETDELFRQVAIEGLAREPVAGLVLARDVGTFFGLDVRSAFGDGAHVGPYRSAVWNMGEPPHYVYTAFNSGGCPERALTPALWSQYEWDADATAAAGLAPVFVLGNYLRNILRLVAGLLALGVWWRLFRSPHRLFFLPLAAIALATMFIVALGVGAGAHTKYEHSVFPLMLLATAGGVMTLAGRRRGAGTPRCMATGSAA